MLQYIKLSASKSLNNEHAKQQPLRSEDNTNVKNYKIFWSKTVKQTNKKNKQQQLQIQDAVFIYINWL